MTNRKQKVKELLENFQSLKHTMVFHSSSAVRIPRITPSQWGVLMFVEQRKKSTVKDVARALGITSSATTQLVDGLVTNGYILREPPARDKRTVILALSKKTKAKVDRMKKQAIRKFLKFFEALNDKELDQYILLNKKIVNRLLKQ